MKNQPKISDRFRLESKVKKESIQKAEKWVEELEKVVKWKPSQYGRRSTLEELRSEVQQDFISMLQSSLNRPSLHLLKTRLTQSSSGIHRQFARTVPGLGINYVSRLLFPYIVISDQIEEVYTAEEAQRKALEARGLWGVPTTLAWGLLSGPGPDTALIRQDIRCWGGVVWVADENGWDERIIYEESNGLPLGQILRDQWH